MIELATVTGTSPITVLKHGDLAGSEASVALAPSGVAVDDVVLVEQLGRTLVIVQVVEAV